MNQLFQNAHFLIYPTKADAMGMALSEAAAFGVPALASNVGGIADIVKTNITGQTFAVDSASKRLLSFCHALYVRRSQVSIFGLQHL